MVYNKFLYNTALYNAGRDEAPGISRSIIQAHTGPHIQAVVGSTVGVSLISDFIIIQGPTPVPTSFCFPDLRAIVKVVFPSSPPYLDRTPFLPANIRGFGFGDLPACVFPSNRIPDLSGNIFGLFEKNLGAIIEGFLATADLSATIFIPQKDLAGFMLGIAAPNLPAFMLGIAAPNLGAMIHSPLDLVATLTPVSADDLLAIINSLSTASMGGSMLGIAAPNISAFLRAFASGTSDIPSSIYGSGFLTAIISSVFTGDTGFAVGLPATISDGDSGSGDTSGFIRALSTTVSNLAALIKTGGEHNLTAVIDFLGGLNLSAYVGAIPFGAKNAELSALAQPVRFADLATVMTINENVKFLSASIDSMRRTSDLSAFLRVAETFVTAIMTVTTMSARNLRAIVGKPDCAGGSASANLTASSVPQFVGNIGASLVSFAQSNLGATINNATIFHAIDKISFSFTPTNFRVPSSFRACDDIIVSFSPFRGKNLGAIISAVLSSADLGAQLTAAFPLLRVVPSISRITSVDHTGLNEFDIQEIRLQMEGDLLEYFYVQGTSNFK